VYFTFSFYFLDSHHINYNLQILFELLAKGGTVKGLIKEKDLVQVSNLVRSFYRYKSFQMVRYMKNDALYCLLWL
jgi:hypothetical protein